jgi:hypothetical protein
MQEGSYWRTYTKCQAISVDPESTWVASIADYLNSCLPKPSTKLRTLDLVYRPVIALFPLNSELLLVVPP